MKNKEIKKQNKQFGIVFSIFFFILLIFFYHKNNTINYYLIIICLSFLIITFTYPSIFHYPNKIWIFFGVLLSKIATPILLSAIYIFLFLPIGLILKISGKDLLKLNYQSKSYWNKIESSNVDFNKQY